MLNGNCEDIKIKINTFDIFYDYKINNKIEKRKDKIIIITTDKMEEKLINQNIYNSFIDITYKVIPKKHKGKKLLTISGYDNETKHTYICALIILRYEDNYTFELIFKYMNEIFHFKPINIHIDYSLALRKAILKEGVFDTKPVIIHCFFHFVQAIVKKMKEYKIFNKKMNKYSFEILKNIELICFLKHEYIKNYIKFLENKLTGEKEKKLFNYLQKTWFNKNYDFYNYSSLFDIDNMADILPHFFITNNIAEALHNKINQYLPNKKITNTNFINSIRNVIINFLSSHIYI